MVLRKLLRRKTDIVEKTVRVAARPETVFTFFTYPQKMVKWKGTEATLDPRPGGVYRVNVTGRDIAVGQYVEIVPNKKVVFTWGWEGEHSPISPGSTTVEITLTPDGDGTIVHLRHYGLAAAEAREQHAIGWGHYLERLALASIGIDPGVDRFTGILGA
jgi:uncharacterized protein YndB with AHSA1/START domain